MRMSVQSVTRLTTLVVNKRCVWGMTAESYWTCETALRRDIDKDPKVGPGLGRAAYVKTSFRQQPEPVLGRVFIMRRKQPIASTLRLGERLPTQTATAGF
jgi:hypothetical protein